jgi:hypothetical protein
MNEKRCCEKGQTMMNQSEKQFGALREQLGAQALTRLEHAESASEAFAILGEREVELPDELLEGIVGGVSPADAWKKICGSILGR